MDVKFDSGVNMYDMLSSQIEETFTEDIDEDDGEGLSGKEYRDEVKRVFLKENRKAIVTGCLFFLTFFHCVDLLIRYFLAGMSLNTNFVLHSPVLLLIYLAFPFGVWAYSTSFDYWNFHNRKMGTMTLCVVHVALMFLNYGFYFLGNIFVPFFAEMALHTGAGTTPQSVFNLARVFFFIVPAVIPLFFAVFIVRAVHRPITRAGILAFKLNKVIDRRSKEEKLFAYDQKIVKNLETGETFVVKEKDRMLHQLSNGTTGTGKTSSTMEPSIAQDLDQIAFNLEYQKKTMEAYLKEGKVRLKYPLDDKKFSLDAFEVVDIKKDGDIIEELKWKAKVAGINAIAPTAAFSDAIYSKAAGNGLVVNRVDPTLTKNGKLKPGFKGFNPMYLSDDLSPFKFFVESSKKAVLVADVMQAIYDESGQSDVYFASLNRQITTTLCLLVMLTFPFFDENKGRQPTLVDVQNILNDFDKAKKYHKKLLSVYGKGAAGNGENVDKLHPDLGLAQSVYDVVEHDILGEGKASLFDQCRGLRTIFDSTLRNPYIRNVLCAQDSVDLDKALAEGEICLVNYAIELGPEAKGFGLFYLLSLINAFKARPGNENTRLPNFVYIDELPVLLHPALETCFTLLRQFRGAMFVAIQSLSQTEKNKSTAFLKQVLLSNCGTHFVFGRSAVEEMELYEKLAGESLKEEMQEGISKTSIISDAPSESYTQRFSVKRQKNIDGTDVRARDFQEVTVVSVDNGSPVSVFFGKVSFLPKYKRIKRKIYTVDWMEYCGAKEGVKENGVNVEETRKSPSYRTQTSTNSMGQRVPVMEDDFIPAKPLQERNDVSESETEEELAKAIDADAVDDISASILKGFGITSNTSHYHGEEVEHFIDKGDTHISDATLKDGHLKEEQPLEEESELEDEEKLHEEQVEQEDEEDDEDDEYI